jgi:iron(III) transport system permease protein
MATIAPNSAERVRQRRERSWFPATMVGLASFASLIVVTLLGVVMWLSLVKGSPGDPKLLYTLEHYRSMFLDPFTYRIIANTLGFSSITLCVALCLGLPIAWLIERTDFPGKSIVLTLLTVALVIPGFSVGLGWLFLLHPRIGVINVALEAALGLHSAPFNISTLAGMGFVQGLSLTPVTFIMTAIVLRSIDPSFEEAASTSGASLWQRLRRVTLPLAWPGILAASIYVFTIGFAAFDIPAVLGLSNRIFTFSTYVYLQVSPTYGQPDYGGVAALSVFMVALAVGFSWWYGKMQARAPRYAVVTGKGYRPGLVKLGRFRWLAVCFVVLYFVLSELLPILSLIWSAGLPYLQPVSVAALKNMSFANFRDLPDGLLAAGIRNTAILMVVVPSITLTLSVAFSWVVLRSRLRWRGVFDFFAFLPHTVPSIVFSVAAWLLALFVLSKVLPLYGTIWVLVLVYVVATLSYGTRMTNGALIQIHRELEEAATMSGAGPAATVRSVIIPLLKPALAYAWIWIALLSYRELTLPVLLASRDNQPLAVIVWSLVHSSSYGAGSVVAVTMLALMAPILGLYWMIARRTGIVPAT